MWNEKKGEESIYQINTKFEKLQISSFFLLLFRFVRSHSRAFDFVSFYGVPNNVIKTC